MAHPSEAATCLKLILGTAAGPADDVTVSEFTAFTQSRKIDLGEIGVAEVDGKISWAALPMLSAGRTMLLFTPGQTPAPPAVGAVGAVIELLCQRHAPRDIQLAQALLEPGDDLIRRIFESRGFMRMAELIYLHAAVRRARAPPLPPGYAVRHYSTQTHAMFAAAILESYQDSLDCPGLNGVRGIEDIISGHKASGEFDPAHWFVLCHRGSNSGIEQPHGVLILSRLPRGDTAELVYLGLVPQGADASWGNG